MRPFFALYKEGLTWLRRDKIFGPVMLIGLAVSIFANVASGWSIEDFRKILFDIGLAGFRLTGGLVAILWGSRMIHDALNERSLDPRLAAPIHRGTWYMARFAALASSLLLMGVIFAIWWQITMYINQFGIMTNLQGWALAMLCCEWLILAALAMTMATFSGFGISLFATAALWIAGLMAPLIASTKDNSISESQSILLDWIADVWNFQRFNLLDQLTASGQTINLADLSVRLAWAGSLLVAVLTVGLWRFSERDLG